MDLVERITRLREARQWSEYHLAKMAGISQSTLSNLINRGNNPSVYTLEKIANAFDLTMAQFFNTEDDVIYVAPDQKEILEYWHRLDPSQKTKVISYMQGILSS